ncbi:ankyrin repeat domain-containing protein [Acinetobacter indicus]|uniref:ankyrin repeat domain-containing protein n=1 Tax=Acinetobacter indicus TaxID=756892 RepID=UPI00144420C9|nr:ankyrin repeat domain-containing protein [Acinetobacter indicus]
MRIFTMLCAGLFSLGLGTAPAWAQADSFSATSQPVAPSAAQELIDLFFAAARSGQHDVIQEFLQHGFPVDVRNPAGFTPLMMATYYGHQPIVSTLLTYGADRCARDQKGHTALMAAIVKAEWGIARQLRQVDCDTHAAQTGQLTAEEFARVFGQQQQFQKLSED